MKKVYLAFLGGFVLALLGYGVGGCGGSCGEFSQDTTATMRTCSSDCPFAVAQTSTLVQNGCSLSLRNFLTTGDDLAATVETSGFTTLDPITALESGEKFECEGALLHTYNSGGGVEAVTAYGWQSCAGDNGSTCSFYMDASFFSGGCP